MKEVSGWKWESYDSLWTHTVYYVSLVCYSWLRLYMFIAAQIAQVAQSVLFSGPGNLGSNKEIQPEYRVLIAMSILHSRPVWAVSGLLKLILCWKRLSWARIISSCRCRPHNVSDVRYFIVHDSQWKSNIVRQKYYAVCKLDPTKIWTHNI